MVTMIEGSCSAITMTPLIAPITRPEKRPMTMASGIGMPEACAQAKMQAESAMLAAGDRSISPEMITIVRTSATIATSA